ncbi:hypothetical protein [Spirosoma spitsbergense]|uniref:hypothetical protein n=1 Tax=Spirosoma spitsbergense TaxID=431554 RepID=UPI00036F31E4|nr:hypothetical protein [Spirosoma spitsbergense]
MKTALYVTDGSVDSALLLRAWLTRQPTNFCRITVVLPYSISPDEPLHKDVLRPVKEKALTLLQNWQSMLGDSQIWPMALEPFFATPEHALTIYLLLRHYDYWLTDNNPSPCGTELITHTSTQRTHLAAVSTYADGYSVPLNETTLESPAVQ